MPLLAEEVLDEARNVYLNDPNADVYDNATLLSYLSVAYDELQRELEDNQTQHLIEESLPVTVTAGSTSLTLPSDFISPIRLIDRDTEQEIGQVASIYGIDSQDIIAAWEYRENAINLVAPTTNRSVQLYYYKSLTPITSISTAIPILNSKTFLSARTAALAARFLGRNQAVALECDVIAGAARTKLVGVAVKQNQGFPTSRKPYNYRRASRWPLR